MRDTPREPAWSPAREEPPAAADPDAPPGDRLDELLADPPLGEYNRGRLGGYAAGQRARRLTTAVGVAVVLAIMIGGYALIRHLQSRQPVPVHAAPLPAGADVSGRSRVMTWSSGQARLALSREPPGADTIELPDRRVRLADGCDAAQIKVDVREGKTRGFKVLYGEVVQAPRTPAAGP